LQTGEAAVHSGQAHNGRAPEGATPAGAVFKRWLFTRSRTRGIHTHQEGTWAFHSYASIAGTAHGLAAVLRREAGGMTGCVPVGVLSEHAPTVLAAFGAAWLRGDAALVLPQPLTFRQLDDYTRHVQHLLRLAGCRHVVTGEDSAAFVGALSDALGPGVTFIDVRSAGNAAAGSGDFPAPSVDARAGHGDIVINQFTSGSTGPPMLIGVSTHNLAANLEGMRQWLGWRDGRDAWASWLPLHHDMGLIGGLLVPVARNSDLWSLTPGEFLRDPACWLDALTNGRATVTAAPTFGYSYAARRAAELPAAASLSEWRVACVGAEIVTEEVLRNFTQRFGPHGFSARAWCPAYGMAEATLCVTAVMPGEETRVACIADGATLRIGAPVEVAAVRTADYRSANQQRTLVACGRPIQDTSADITDEAGNCLPDGYFGAIVVRGPGVARIRRSYDGPSHDGTAGTEADPADGPVPAEPIAPDGAGRLRRPHDRLHHTRDAGFKLDGELFVVGRLGDGVKVRGDFVDCECLELRLASALAVPPERVALGMGQIGTDITAVLLLRAEAPRADARARADGVVRSVLGPGARLIIVNVDRGEIPKTSSGKVKRAEIWRTWAASPAAADRRTT
jgi:acyl-CoA synthetase (AMP-forming)/AMP-acid ligase II